MLNFLKAKIQVDSLVLSEDMSLIDELGTLVRCCCDPALCACYVCLEDAQTVRHFSFLTGGIALGLLLFAGCCIKSWRSKRHGDKSSFAQVMPSDSQAIANLRMRTEARLHARQAWQEWRDSLFVCIDLLHIHTRSCCVLIKRHSKTVIDFLMI